MQTSTHKQRRPSSDLHADGTAPTPAGCSIVFPKSAVGPEDCCAVSCALHTLTMHCLLCSSCERALHLLARQATSYSLTISAAALRLCAISLNAAAAVVVAVAGVGSGVPVSSTKQYSRPSQALHKGRVAPGSPRSAAEAAVSRRRSGGFA